MGGQALFLQQFVGTGISAHLKAFDFQRELERISYAGVIIYYEYHLLNSVFWAQSIHRRNCFP